MTDDYPWTQEALSKTHLRFVNTDCHGDLAQLFPHLLRGGQGLERPPPADVHSGDATPVPNQLLDPAGRPLLFSPH